MSDSRARILARARAAVSQHASVPEVPRSYLGAEAGQEPAEVLETFVDRLLDYGAKVRTGTPGEAGALLAAAARAHGARRLGVPGGSSWALPGIEMVPDEPALSPAVLDQLDGVITGCALAIAETGTIVLDGGRESGRRALTLIPDLHICMVDAGRIVSRVPDAIARLEQNELIRCPITFVSGPSATSDIGFERVEGVHGPRRLEVIVVIDPADGR